MKRIVDVLVAAVILAIPAFALAQAPAATVATAQGHHYVAASLIRPDSAASPGDPGVI